MDPKLAVPVVVKPAACIAPTTVMVSTYRAVMVSTKAVSTHDLV